MDNNKMKVKGQISYQINARLGMNLKIILMYVLFNKEDNKCLFAFSTFYSFFLHYLLFNREQNNLCMLWKVVHFVVPFYLAICIV